MALRKHAFVDFTQTPPSPLFAQTTNAIATAADNQVDWFTANGHYFEHIQTGANAALQYTTAAAGWTVPVDDAAGDGVEITQGIIAARDTVFTVGTDPAFFLQVTMSVVTVARGLVYGIGFRNNGAYVDITTAALVSSVYDDKVFFGCNSAVGNLIHTTSIANVDTITEATVPFGAGPGADLANNTWVTFRINVSGTGAVTYLLGRSLVSAAASRTGLAAPATPTAMTITNATVVAPYMPLVSANAGAVMDVVLDRYECGLQ